MSTNNNGGHVMKMGLLLGSKPHNGWMDRWVECFLVFLQ